MALIFNKKGSVEHSMFWVLAFIFTFAVSVVIGWYVFSSIRTQFLSMTMVTDIPEAVQIIGYGRSTILSLDYLFVLFIAGLLIANIVAVIQIKTHPVFFFVSLFALIVVIILAAQFSNIFESIVDTGGLSDFTTDFPIITWFMDQYPITLFLMGIIILIVLYGKYRFMGGYE